MYAKGLSTACIVVQALLRRSTTDANLPRNLLSAILFPVPYLPAIATEITHVKPAHECFTSPITVYTAERTLLPLPFAYLPTHRSSIHSVETARTSNKPLTKRTILHLHQKSPRAL